jgi:hypothetical protein
MERKDIPTPGQQQALSMIAIACCSVLEENTTFQQLWVLSDAGNITPYHDTNPYYMFH